MTIKDLQRIVLDSKESTKEDSQEMQDLQRRLQGKPFYIWTNLKHKDTTGYGKTCCFNHIIGLPNKNGIPQPLWDYEEMVHRALMVPGYINSVPNKGPSAYTMVEKRRRELDQKGSYLHAHKLKHVAILKASGLGITELILRFMVWLCLRNEDLKNSQMIIFTGPRLDLAVSLINRIKGLFKPHGITFNSKETVVEINGVRLEAFPSHHADSARGLPNVSFIFVDEASFIPDRETDNIMDIMLRNVPKSNPYLVVVSTPQKPHDFMYELMSEDIETSPFKKMHLDWTYGIDKIYDKNDIDKIAKNRSFLREFCLKFAGLEGNVLSPTAIDRCIATGESLSKTAPIDNWDIDTNYVMSIDIGWGSSAMAILVSRYVNGKVQLLYCKEFTRALFSDIISEVWRLKNKCKGNLQNIIIDASATELYTGLCTEFNQNPSLEYLKEKQSWVKRVHADIYKYLFVVPVAFGSQSTGGRAMLSHAKRLIEEQEYDGTALVGIDKQFQNVIESCRSAYENDGKLDKDRTVYADTFDALLMNLQFYRFGNK